MHVRAAVGSSFGLSRLAGFRMRALGLLLFLSLFLCNNVQRQSCQVSHAKSKTADIFTSTPNADTMPSQPPRGVLTRCLFLGR